MAAVGEATLGSEVVLLSIVDDSGGLHALAQKVAKIAEVLRPLRCIGLPRFDLERLYVAIGQDAEQVHFVLRFVAVEEELIGEAPIEVGLDKVSNYHIFK